MLGKPWAVFYSFLWAIAYGMIISIILALVLFTIMPKINDVSDLSNAATLVGFASLVAFVAQVYLMYGTPYQYGLVDCPEAASKLTPT